MKGAIAPKALSDALPESAAFLETFAPLSQRHTSRDSMEHYLIGLLTDLPHKTADPIAAEVAGTSTKCLQPAYRRRLGYASFRRGTPQATAGHPSGAGCTSSPLCVRGEWLGSLSGSASGWAASASRSGHVRLQFPHSAMPPVSSASRGGLSLSVTRSSLPHVPGQILLWLFQDLVLWLIHTEQIKSFDPRRNEQSSTS